MSQPQKIAAQRRDLSAAAVRRARNIPAVLYGHEFSSQSVQVDAKDLQKTLQAAGTTSLVTLTLAGQDHPVIIRELQYHPLKGTLLHVDFYRVRLDEAIETSVPLVFTGEASAVKDLGGVLVRNLDTVKVKALPKDLPHDITVDIASLKTFEKVIRVSDLTLPDGVTVLESAATTVALVQAPRSEEELAALTEAVKEDVAVVEGMKTKAEQAAATETAAPASPSAVGKDGESKPDAKN